MNTFGSVFRVSIFGASHGSAVGVSIDGVPAGLPIHMADFMDSLKRRQGGIRKGTTPRKEADVPNFISGVFNNHTTGAPLTILFENANTRSADYEQQKSIPRPGHADFVAQQKFRGFQDYRGGGHFSARLTVGIVAAGVIAQQILGSSICINAEVTEVGGCATVEEGLQKAIAQKDSVGGVVSCTVKGVPIGWGEPFWDSVESKLAHACFAIPAVKGIAFGAGFEAARMFGSEHNDTLLDKQGRTETNYAGGIVGGLSNGNDLSFQIAIKPTSSTPKEQVSLNVVTNELAAFSIKGRHDLCVALRAPVIVEAMTAIVLADLKLLNKAIHQH